MMKKTHDIRIDRKLLHPQLDVKLDRMLKKCADAGIYLIITEGFRTVKYQDSLYAKGRTVPGKIVTNARGNSYSSQHQWGIAFDIAINDPAKLYDTAMIKKAAAIGKKVGLSWGGDWKSIVDTPHFYLGTWGSTTQVLKSKYGTPDTFKKTWTAAVTRTKGLNLYNDKAKLTKLITIPCKSKVDVLYTSKLWYAKVRYKGLVGYVRKKYIG